MTNWLMSVIESFDGSDIFAFIGGVLAMVVWKNFQAMKWNRSRKSGGDRSVMGTGGTDGEHKAGRKVSLPKLNAKIMVWVMIVVVLVGTIWASYDTNSSIRKTAAETRHTAVLLCEGSKVSRVEAKGLQDLFFALLNVPPEIEQLPPQDPVRKQFGQDIGLKYLGTLEDAQKQRQALVDGKSIDPNFWERYFGPDNPEIDCNAI